MQESWVDTKWVWEWNLMIMNKRTMRNGSSSCTQFNIVYNTYSCHAISNMCVTPSEVPHYQKVTWQLSGFLRSCGRARNSAPRESTILKLLIRDLSFERRHLQQFWLLHIYDIGKLQHHLVRALRSIEKFRRQLTELKRLLKINKDVTVGKSNLRSGGSSAVSC